MAWIDSTKVLSQIQNVEVGDLFTNPYFLGPFAFLILYIVMTHTYKNLVLVGLGIGLWAFSGSSYTKDIFIDGELQLNKVWPALAVGFGTIGTIVLMVFGSSE